MTINNATCTSVGGLNSSTDSNSSNSDSVSVSQFVCPVCLDLVLPPLLPCQIGHLVCSSCRPYVNCCPICHGPLGNIRDLAMEECLKSCISF